MTVILATLYCLSVIGVEVISAFDEFTIKSPQQDGHTGMAPIYAVAFSPDGQQILTCEDERAFLWDAETGRKLKCFDKEHEAAVNAGIFSPDGQKILTADMRGVVFEWSPSSFKKPNQLMQKRSFMWRLKFSPTGKYLLGLTGDEKVHSNSMQNVIMWEVASDKPVQVFQGHSEDIYSFDISQKEDRLLTGSHDNKAILWDFSTGKILRTFKLGAPVRVVKFSPDSRQLLTVSADWAILWETETGKMLRTFYLGSFFAAKRFVFCTPDSQRIITVSIETMAPPLEAGFKNSFPCGIPMSRFVVITLWDVNGLGKRTIYHLAQTERINIGQEVGAISPNGQQFLMGEGNAAIVFDLSTGEKLLNLGMDDLFLRVPSQSKTILRKWTDVTGKYSVEAELDDFHEGKVRLKKTDGKIIKMPIEKLSSMDQENIKSQDIFAHAFKRSKIALLDIKISTNNEKDVDNFWSSHDERSIILSIAQPMLETCGYEVVTQTDEDVIELPSEKADIRLSISADFNYKETKEIIITTAHARIASEGASGKVSSITRKAKFTSKEQCGSIIYIPGGRLCDPPKREPGLTLDIGGFVVSLAQVVSRVTGVPERDILLGALRSNVTSKRKVPFVRFSASFELAKAKVCETEVIKALLANYCGIGSNEILRITPAYEMEYDKAAALIGKMGQNAVKPLISILTAEEPKVPYTGSVNETIGPGIHPMVVQLPLAKIGHPAVEPLTTVLNDKTSLGRKYIPYILGEIQDKSALDSLINASKDDSIFVREEAAKALAKFITEKRAKQALENMAANDPEWQCRNIANKLIEDCEEKEARKKHIQKPIPKKAPPKSKANSK